ncbi:protein C2-DOMAIN ABA-RELATED 4-like isoform X1 [Olea europaea var. sylvestris]|uniref:protein C2-DOMAIN ABA-RELATED 4-like isoform X1 n=1 Tax=Olea europaea var. sylvestris TaxID=158386 RepID=UPI000C1D6E03|nr:protein C2-DOMAIN ABA-RELATED 4-like isoform X1 [Olea europaea var. sylvestris]
MENLLGLQRINVIRGIKLAIRDASARSSDPYVVVTMANQKLRTRAVKKNVNPEWNEELTLAIADPNLPIKLEVFDRDTFTPDDKIGDAEFDIKTFVEVAMMRLQSMTSGTIIRKIKPNRENCLAEESPITWENQKVIQRMYLRLRNVECGEIELQLQWIETPDSRGL